MARRRKYGEDLTAAEWHRLKLPVLYERNGHRLDMADRDWTEFCHFCKEPLGLWEEVIDRGQDLSDKATTVTRRLAERANLPALIVAPRTNRPPDVQAQIDDLHAEIRRLEALHPIIRFTVKRLTPTPGEFLVFQPDEFAAEIYLLHRDHHQRCRRAQRSDPVYHVAAIKAARAKSKIWVPRQGRLTFREAG